MLRRFALVSIVSLASCAPVPPPAPKAPQACVDPAPAIAPPPAPVQTVEVKPALTLEPLVAGDAARWKLTNQTTEPLNIGIEYSQRYWARDCRSPLQRIDNDGRMHCMPIHIETTIPAFSKIDPGASVVITLSLQLVLHGPEPALPAGRYQLAIPTTNPTDRSPGPTARVNFRLDGLAEDEARQLVPRVAFAMEHRCVTTPDLAERALAWTAPASIAFAAMDMPGAPRMRERYAQLMMVYPEAQEKLRRDAYGSTFDSVVAARVLLSSSTQPRAEVREDALRFLPMSLRVKGFDPILVHAVVDSDVQSPILETVAWRVSNADEVELEQWQNGLSCIGPRGGNELAFADLIHAFRMRAQKAKPELAAALRARADTFEKLLREKRGNVDLALQIARSGRPPPKLTTDNKPNSVHGCGSTMSGLRPDPVCAGTEVTPNDPALRFLTTPMKLTIE